MPGYDDLLVQIAEHGNLRKACRDLGVNKSVFLDAVDRDSDLADQYTRARARGWDNMMEEVIDSEIDDPQKARLDWDRKRWHVSKLAPKRYGDKVAVEHDVSESLAERLGRARSNVG